MIFNIMRLTILGLITVACSVVIIIATPFDIKYTLRQRIMEIWAKLILKVSRVEVEVEGNEKIQRNKTYIFVANHLSLFDIPSTIGHINSNIRMLAKKELARIPVFGWAMYLVDHIFIDRQDRKKALKSLDKAMKKIQKKNISVMLYPEGTRSPDGEIKAFKKGAFVMAIKSGFPVVPVTIYGSRQVLPKKSLRIKKGKIKIIIHNPIPSEDKKMSDRGEFTEQIRNIIVDTYQKIRG